MIVRYTRRAQNDLANILNEIRVIHIRHGARRVWRG